MAWTAPRTWVHAEIVSAAQMNTHLRDNLLETAPAKASAAGQTVHSTAANAIAMVTASKLKTADQSHAVVSLTPDTHLVWPVAASEAWAWTAFLYFTAASGSIVVNASFTMPVGSLGWYYLNFNITDMSAGGTPGVGSFAMNVNNALMSASPGGRLAMMSGVFLNNVTPGNVQLQWGPNTAVNITLKAGSYLDLKRLA